MDGATHDFARALWRLYEAAEEPEATTLAALVCEHLPVEDEVTAPRVRQWLRGEAVPSSRGELDALLAPLYKAVARLGKTGRMTTRPPGHWERLWRDACGAAPDGGTVGQGQPAAGEVPPHPRGETVNSIDAGAELGGPTLQARDIQGDVHVHAVEPPPLPPVPRSPAPPVMRIHNGQETIEFYDDGLARIWITARLQMESGNEPT